MAQDTMNIECLRDDAAIDNGGRWASRLKPSAALKSHLRNGTKRGRPWVAGCTQRAPSALIGVLVARRISMAISREALARKLGYDEYTIGRWERGEMIPSIIRFQDWCAALGMTLLPPQPIEQ